MLPDLFGTSAPPGVRRPVVEIAFGGGAGGIGGLGDIGGLAADAAAAVGLGGGSAADPWQRSLASISIELGLAPEVDAAHITIASDTQAPSVALGDEGTIALGYSDDEAVPVFSGTIDAIRRVAGQGQRLTVVNGSAALAALRIDQSYQDQAPGDVVRDLVQRAGCDTGNITSGPDLSFLVLDGGRTAWEHVARLARVCGQCARVNAEGEFDFAPPDDGEPVQTFAWGVDILALEQQESTAPFDAVTISGEGAAGGSGKEAWNWLIKQPAPVTAEAGGGSRSRTFADRALRSADAVRGAAQALADAAARAATAGTLTVPGAPHVAPGLRIAIEGVPGGASDGTYLVTRVRHSYAKRTGFRTTITFVGGSSSAPGGGLLGGLL